MHPLQDDQAQGQYPEDGQASPGEDFLVRPINPHFPGHHGPFSCHPDRQGAGPVQEITYNRKEVHPPQQGGSQLLNL